MSSANVLIVVDGREVVARRDRLTGLSVLATVGAHPGRGDVLIREDVDAARIVPPDDLVEIAEPVPASFRVHRGGRFESRPLSMDPCQPRDGLVQIEV